MRVLPALSFSAPRAAAAGALLTFGVAALALSWDMLARVPAAFERMGHMVDPEVVLLFVPLCALVFVLAVEVVRMSGNGRLPNPRPAMPRLPRHWRERRNSP
jgi:hypothetical protein